MPTRCVKIKLTDGSSAKVAEWASELNRRAGEVRSTLQTEGVSLEAAFLDVQADGSYLYYVMRSDDFEKAKAVAQRSAAAIDAYHQAFKKACWDSSRTLETLIDFSSDGAP